MMTAPWSLGLGVGEAVATVWKEWTSHRCVHQGIGPVSFLVFNPVNLGSHDFYRHSDRGPLSIKYSKTSPIKTPTGETLSHQIPALKSTNTPVSPVVSQQTNQLDPRLVAGNCSGHAQSWTDQRPSPPHCHCCFHPENDRQFCSIALTRANQTCLTAGDMFAAVVWTVIVTCKWRPPQEVVTFEYSFRTWSIVFVLFFVAFSALCVSLCSLLSSGRRWFDTCIVFLLAPQKEKGEVSAAAGQRYD
jgi:hypothetical protein